MRRAACLLPLLILSLASARPSRGADGAERVRFPAEVPPRNDILLDNRVPIPMRDGVTLYADVYRPVGDGRYPVLVSSTPYSTERFPTAFDAAVYFSQRGYVYVYQDIRGRHESEGKWAKVAEQTVYHDAEHPSHILLPVIPRRPLRAP